MTFQDLRRNEVKLRSRNYFSTSWTNPKGTNPFRTNPKGTYPLCGLIHVVDVSRRELRSYVFRRIFHPTTPTLFLANALKRPITLTNRLQRFLERRELVESGVE